MFEVIADMPEGTYGFRTSGPLTADDYREMIAPLRAAIDRGERIRMLFAIGEGFKETPGGLWEDLEGDVTLGLGHLSAWERTALVTDESWARHAVKLLAWLSPGELSVFGSDEFDEAKRWLSR